MPPLPEDSTARVWVDYSDGHNEHSLMLRYDSIASSEGDALQTLADFLAAMDGSLFLITILGARRAFIESNVTNPVTWPGAATYGTGGMTLAGSPEQVMFQGRSSSGRKWKLSLFGWRNAIPNTYRILNADSADVAAAYAALANGVGINAVICIDGQPPVFKDYVSFNFNNHWEKEARP